MKHIAAIKHVQQLKTPLCVGHEVIGQAVRVEDKVTTVKVGDRVGIGAQIWICMKCKVCKEGNDNYYPNQIGEPSCPTPALSTRGVNALWNG